MMWASSRQSLDSVLGYLRTVTFCGRADGVNEHGTHSKTEYGNWRLTLSNMEQEEVDITLFISLYAGDTVHTLERCYSTVILAAE